MQTTDPLKQISVTAQAIPATATDPVQAKWTDLKAAACAPD